MIGYPAFARLPAADVALAVLLVAPAVAGSVVASGKSAPLTTPGYLLVIAATLGLASRRRRPLFALAVAALCTSTYLSLGYAYGPILIVFMLAVYSAIRHAALRPALWCAAAALALTLTHLLISDRPLGWLGVAPVAAWVVVPATAGYGLRLRHDTAERLRAEIIRQRVGDERLRVAQEVHDIVGHGLAAIKMQADIALHVMNRRPDQADLALRAISRTSQQALDELRATLAAVRSVATGERTPPAGLHGLEPLRRRMADAGVDVRLHVSGEAPPGIPATVDLAGYRVVQESLTNVLRHGGSGQADVTVRYAPDAVTITVGNPCTGPAARHAGSGIAGMRARVEALGGAFRAGPVGPRFEVHARLPTGSRP